MEDAIFGCPIQWELLLPPEVRRLRSAGELAEKRWEILVLLPTGLPAAGKASCHILLLPGDCGSVAQIRAESVITYGLSPRDSLTLSSLEKPVLCVQRALLRPDGAVVEPQELPLGALPAPPEHLLPLLGLKLLRMPLTGTPFL